MAMDENSQTDSVETPVKPKRGRGRGGKFFVLDRAHWDQLWGVETNNRLNLITAFLVLLAGTGADHRLTKWSAKACEERAGMGKPRARAAIDELIAAGLAERTEASRPAYPQYRLAEPKDLREPIFLPVQLVTGFQQEVSILRRVRETGDDLLLRMLIDLYGLVQTDATFGVPLGNLRLYDSTNENCRKVTEKGANAIWALHLGETKSAQGDWCNLHATRTTQSKIDWDAFWNRLDTLQMIGALWFEPWVFNGERVDAEPLYPVETADRHRAVPENVHMLSALMIEVVEILVGDRTYLLDQNPDRTFVVLPAHHQPPAIKGVARLRAEADTPGRRLAHAKRMETIERNISAYKRLLMDAKAARYDRPIRVG